MVPAHCVCVDVSSKYSVERKTYYTYNTKMAAPHCEYVDVSSN
jgi:hypothetical protein